MHAGASTTPPRVRHAPISHAAPGQPIEIRAIITADAPIARATLLYRNLNQFQTHDRIDLVPTVPGSDTYTATIPAEHVSIEWDLMYHLEVVDALGNATIHPGLHAGGPDGPAHPAGGAPYVVVSVAR